METNYSEVISKLKNVDSDLIQKSEGILKRVCADSLNEAEKTKAQKELEGLGWQSKDLQSLFAELSINAKKEEDAKKKKKKAHCICKKKCKGPCKALKKKEEEEKKKDAVNDESPTYDGGDLNDIPKFQGRKKEESENNVRDIKVIGISLGHKGQALIEEGTLLLNWGNRYGLVGKNGCGKSTLMKAIAARDFPLPNNLMIYLCESEVPATERTALETVLDADIERAALLEKQEELLNAKEADPHKLQKIQERLFEIDSDSAPARSAMILDGLGFDQEMQSKKTKEFSGGWRMRISLARALMLQPDILLLDEPTNHLDLEACLWLEAYLKKWNKILLMVSHAQDFLDGVCTDTIHFYKNKLNYYGGNYSQFCKTRQELYVQYLKKYQTEQKEISNIKGFVQKFGHGSRASQAKSRIKAMQKMVEGGLADRPTLDRNLKFYFEDPAPMKGSVVAFIGAGFSYNNGKKLYENLNFGLHMESRIALVGPNGVGKSTLLKLISGDLIPSEGSMIRSPHVKVGRFHQHFVDQMDMNQTALDFIMSSFPNTPQEKMRAELGKFGLKGHQQLCPMGYLSGGQKSRVVFCYIALQCPGLLLLDEPTNHLDMETIDTLSEAINEFKGAVVVVSHDTRLIKNIAENIMIVEDRTVKPFYGSIMEYRLKVIADKGLDLDE